MTKILDGLELAGFIKERQAKQVRALRQASHVFPKLAIIQTIDDPVIDTYVRLKQKYGEDILIDVDRYKVTQDELMGTVKKLNDDESVHGVIIQLPLEDKTKTNEAVNAVAPNKDVDGLGSDATMTPATPMAIDWLLAGYNIVLRGKSIAIVGNGRLVGAPLAKLWQPQGLNVQVYDDEVKDLAGSLVEADIIVAATGAPNLITRDMIKPGSVVVDAGISTDSGKVVGDLAEDVRELDDITVTPIKGGVGPLTVCALFDNVINSARNTIESK